MLLASTALQFAAEVCARLFCAMLPWRVCLTFSDVCFASLAFGAEQPFGCSGAPAYLFKIPARACVRRAREPGGAYTCTQEWTCVLVRLPHHFVELAYALRSPQQVPTLLAESRW